VYRIDVFPTDPAKPLWYRGQYVVGPVWQVLPQKPALSVPRDMDVMLEAHCN